MAQKVAAEPQMGVRMQSQMNHTEREGQRLGWVDGIRFQGTRSGKMVGGDSSPTTGLERDSVESD